MKKLFVITLVVCLMLGMISIASAEKNPMEMLSSGVLGNEILVFPEYSIGPNGNIIMFVVLEAKVIPKILLDTKKGMLENVKVTEITFTPDIKFFGWFDLPEDLHTIWINNNKIVWKEIK